MKKTYVKPQVVFESFILSTNIAGNCGNPTHTPAYGTCAYEWEEEFVGTVKVFLDSMSACETTKEDGSNGICYHVPTDTTRLFNS